jgi:hypothetical protein
MNTQAASSNMEQRKITSAVPADAVDARYTFDEEKLEQLRKEVPWKNDPKWFKHVTVSPSAIMKMVSSFPL